MRAIPLMEAEPGPLLARAADALQRWANIDGTPTSSVTGSGAIERVESRFALLAGTSYGLAVASGTAALRVALSAVGVGPGDEVILPALDWPAGQAAACSLGAVPVMVAVQIPWCTIDPDAAASAVGPRTRAVLATHLFGIPADVAGLRRRLDPLPIVEDCAHGPGVTLDGRSIGGLGAVGCFSLGPGKLVDAGEGGLITTADDELWRACIRASQHPTRQLVAGIREPDPAMFHSRMHPLAAVVADQELDALPTRLAARLAEASAIAERASSVAGVTVVMGDHRRGPSFYRVVALVESEDSERLLAEVGVRATSPALELPSCSGEKWPIGAGQLRTLSLSEATASVSGQSDRSRSQARRRLTVSPWSSVRSGGSSPAGPLVGSVPRCGQGWRSEWRSP